MNPDQLLELAKQIFVYKCVSTPSWDVQQQARDSLNMAMQFSLAVQAEQAAGSTGSSVSAQPDSPPASQPQMAPPDTSSSAQPLPSDSTTSSGKSPTDSTAGEIAVTDPSAEQPVDTGSTSTQSQDQSAIDQAQAQGRHVQTTTAYPPVNQ